jgi:hypothetical protein
VSAARIRLGAVVVLALIGGVTAGCGSSSKPPTTAATTATGGTVATTASIGATASTSATATAPASAGTSTQSGVAESNPAGDIPDNQAFVAYRDSGGLFFVTVPEGWAQTSETGAVVFSDKYNSIRIQTRPVTSAPTPSSVTSTELPAIAASANGYHAGSVSTVDRKSGQAILANYQANSATNAVTGKYAVEAVERYVFYRAGHEVVLTLAAPVGSDNVDPWRTVTDSFGWMQR